jgi:predicted  nucleic acid-binding Zn-ribbon protein
MKKKFVQVALLSLVACGPAASLVSCSDDDWKNPVQEVENSTAEINKTLGQIDQQIKDLDAKIAENKEAAAAAATAAANAMKAAQDAADEAVAASKAAEAAAKLAEEAAAKAQAAAAEELKQAYEELKALIQQNADAIAANKNLIDGNTEKINENTGKIEGNTKAIQDILDKLAGYANSDEVNEKYAELKDLLAANGVDINNLSESLKSLSGTVAGLETALEVLKGESAALGVQISDLEAAMRSEMGTLEQNLAAQIAQEAGLREAGDAELQRQINELTDKLNNLNLASNLEQFTTFIAQTQTQLEALEAFKEAMEGDFANLSNKVAGLETIINNNKSEIESLKESLNATKSKAEANAAAIAANLALIEANKADIDVIKTDIEELKNFQTEITDEIAGINEEISAIVERLNGLEPLLNTMILDQLRGLVFVPDAYVGGIESALSYRMLFKPLSLVPNTADALSFANGKYKVSQAKVWNNAVAANAKDSEFNPQTVVSYHMNPRSATVTFGDLSIVSNDAEILTSRAAQANIQLDATYNEGAGLKIADGILSVAIKGDASVYGDTNKMPVFALQAEVEGKVDEDGNAIKNTITSDYAMFAQMNVRPTAIQFNQKEYFKEFSNPVYGKDFQDVVSSQQLSTALDHSTATVVAWNGSIDLRSVLQIGYWDIQREEAGVWTSTEDFEKFGLEMNFQLINYTIGNDKVSESSWASIDSATGVLTACVGGDASKQSTDELGHMPLVYVTVKHNGTLVLDGFIKTLIVPTSEEYTAPTAKFQSLTFGCADEEVSGQLDYNVINTLCETTGLSKELFLATYKPVGTEVDEATKKLTQFHKNGNFWEAVPADKAIGFVVNSDLATENGLEYNYTWVFDTYALQQVYQTNAAHTATVYVCYESNDPSIHPSVYVPLQVTVEDKAYGKVGEKLDARWFRDNSTALLNVPVPSNNTQVVNINASLDQLWKGNKPAFTYVAGQPKNISSLINGGYKYYFTAENNRTYKGTDDNGNAITITYSVENATNPSLVGNIEKSNADMGDYALLVNQTQSEYNNTVLKANGEILATLNTKTGYIELADNETALKLLNAFGSMGGADRPEAKLEAIIGVVPFSSCNIAFKLENPDFLATFLRPINVDANNTYAFTDADVNKGSVNIFGMLSFSDWRGVEFKGNEWLYGYYDVKSIVPNLDRMLTNAGNINTDKNKFEYEPSIRNAFSYDEVSEVTYNTNNINPSGSGAIKTQLTTEFGSIVYKNTEVNVKEYQVKIPFTVTYALGQFEVWVTCTVHSTIQ